MPKSFDETPIAYSPREACNAFVPKLGEQVIRAALRDGSLVARRIGVRAYILRDDLNTWLARQPSNRSTRK
jgi:hypothetical protein